MNDQLTLFDRNSDYLESAVPELDGVATSFRVHASLIYKLGESLIADEVTALSELIKNSYDADATICILSIDSNYFETVDGVECRGIIELADNGCGMDLSTIINGWLTLSNSPKKKMKREHKTTPKFHRYPLGDKGLGRLSVQKLGRSMQLITKASTSNSEYTVIIPWGDFLKNTTIDQIPVKILEKHVENNRSYTKIIIRDLFDNKKWANAEQINTLTSSISKIVSPFRAKESTFKIIAKVNGQQIETVNSIFDELLSTARAKHVINYANGRAEIISEFKNAFFYNRATLSQIKSGEFTLTETAIKDFLKVNSKQLKNVVISSKSGVALTETDECLFSDLLSSNGVTDPGNFECEIYEYYLDKDFLAYYYENLNYGSLIHREEYRDLILRFHGIKVVRDGFIVQGFGEGDGGDWLGLSSSSKTTGYFFDLRNDSVIGCVYLSGSKNASLKETTNREGFVEDEFYHTFKRILDDSIKRINRNRKRLNDTMKAYITNSIAFTGNVDANSLSLKPIISQIREDIEKTTPFVAQGSIQLATALDNYKIAKEIVDGVPFVPHDAVKSLDALSENIERISEEYSRLISERDSLSKKLDAINLDFEKLTERLRDLFELAGLGLSVEMFAHEFDTSIRAVKTKNQQVISSQATATVNDLVKHINYITFSLEALRKQMSYFNPGLKFVRAEKQVFLISDFLTNHKEFYSERCKSKRINFKLSINADFKVKINRGMLNQVFDNLFNNSEYWLEFSVQNGLAERKEYSVAVQERGIVVIWDNGIGVSRDIEARLFEPFETKKPNGRGLGLYIVASNLKYSSSRIRLLNERNLHGNLYKFEIDLSQIMQ